MKRFPKKGRQKSASGDLLFISIPKPGGGYSRRYLGKFDDQASHAEYDRLKTNWEESDGLLDPGVSVRSGILTNYELADRFIGWAKGYYRKNGHKTKEPENLLHSLTLVLKHFGGESAGQFSVRELRFIQEQLDKSGRLCRRTVNRRIHHIRRMYRWGAANELIPASVIASLSLLPPLKLGRCRSVDHPPVQAVPLDIVEATLPHLNTVVADMVRLQLLTGCRPEEVRIMRLCDIRQTQPELWHYYPSHDKTEHLRTPGEKKIVPLGPGAIAIIKARTDGRQDAPEEFIFRPADAYAEHLRSRRRKRKTPVQPSQRARHEEVVKKPRRRFREYFTAQTYRDAVKRAALRAKVHCWHPYQLRHTAATETEKRLGWRAAQTLLGHKSPDTTRIYIDQNRELADEIAGKIG